MKVSVIVPVYNVYDYLDKCLDSLAKQTLKDIEILIINDGSPDNSQEIIDKYTKKYANMKSFMKPNGGLSDARNYGLAKAKGDYVAFVDSDDYVHSDYLKKMYDKASLDKSDIVVCEFNYVYGENVVRSYSNLDYTSDVNKKYLLTPPMACIRLIRRSLFQKRMFKKNIFYEDLELMPKLVLETNKISFVNEALYYYVIRDNSIMKQKKFNERLYDIFNVLESNKELLGEKYPQEIEYMYLIHLLRTASLRFMDYDNYRENINKIVDIIKKDFSNWPKNTYLKKSNFKIKIVCSLAYHKCFLGLKILKRLGGK